MDELPEELTSDRKLILQLLEKRRGKLKEKILAEHPEVLERLEQRRKKLEERLEKDLSELERRVLYLHLMGTDYKTIAKLLDRSPKTIDNALQRIKGKMQKILEKDR